MCIFKFESAEYVAKLGCDPTEDLRVNEENGNLHRRVKINHYISAGGLFIGQSLPSFGRVEETFCGSKWYFR